MRSVAIIKNKNDCTFIFFTNIILFIPILKMPGEHYFNIILLIFTRH